METDVTKRYKFKLVKPEDVYVSILKARLVQNSDGWTKMEPVKHEIRPSGSIVIDILVKILMNSYIRRPTNISDLMEVDRFELSMSIHLLTGLTLREFIEEYRLLQAKEYLACTSLSLREIAYRCGFSSQTLFGQHFQFAVNMTPSSYRDCKRPFDYQSRYKWE